MEKEIKYCECGCGTIVKKRFVSGHNTRLDPPMKHEEVSKKFRKPKKEQKTCQCGCGELANPGKKFIIGHNKRGCKISEDHRQKIIEWNKNSWKDENKRYERIQKIKNSLNKIETKEKLKIAGSLGAEAVRKKSQENEEFKLKIIENCRRAAIIGWSGDKREHMLEVRKKQWTDEVRRKMSISTKKRFENINERRKNSQNKLKYFSEIKNRKNQSEVICKAYIEGRFGESKKYRSENIIIGDNKIFVQSSYEKRFCFILEYFFQNNWSRCLHYFPYIDIQGNHRNTIPDFQLLTENSFVFEVKGYLSQEDLYKIYSCCEINNLSYYIVFEEDLNMMEELINNKIQNFPFEKLIKISKNQQ